MDIAAMSVNLSSYKLQQSVSVALAEKVLDVQDASAANLIEMLSTPLQQVPSFDHKLDIKV